MPRRIRSAAIAALLAAIMAGGLLPAAASAAVRAPGFSGREVFKIVARLSGPRHPVASAWGAFTAKGSFIRKDATLVFPKGKIVVRRHVLHTSYFGPDLGTCRFKVVQTGSFRVARATGRYQGLRESGRFRTTVHGRLNKTGTNRCGSRLVARRTVTYETGTAR
jgi:hypothetical protein